MYRFVTSQIPKGRLRYNGKDKIAIVIIIPLCDIWCQSPAEVITHLKFYLRKLSIVLF